jgi:hypothetical protein
MFILTITKKNGYKRNILLGTEYSVSLKEDTKKENWETVFGEMARAGRNSFADEFGVLISGIYRIILTEGNHYSIKIWDSHYQEEISDFGTFETYGGI